MQDNLPSYNIKYYSNAKKIKLKINHFGEVSISAPKFVSHVEIKKFVESNIEWINKTKNNLNLHVRNDANYGLSIPKKINFLFNNEKYDVSYINSKLKPHVIEDQLYVFGKTDEEKLINLRQWINEQAKKILIPRLLELGSLFDLNPLKVSVRCQKTRWGSCSSNKSINLNQNLIFLEPDLVHYLFSHELCHLKYLNHSKSFWQLVSVLDPNYKKHDQLLNMSHTRIPMWAQKR